MRVRLPHMPDDPLVSPLAKALGEALLSGSARCGRRLIVDALFNRKLAYRPLAKDRTLVEVSASAGAAITSTQSETATRSSRQGLWNTLDDDLSWQDRRRDYSAEVRTDRMRKTPHRRGLFHPDRNCARLTVDAVMENATTRAPSNVYYPRKE